MEAPKGAVLVELPLNIQKTEIDDVHPVTKTNSRESKTVDVVPFIKDLRKAKKPVLVVGGGVRCSNGAEDCLKEFENITNIPAVSSLQGLDVVKYIYAASLFDIYKNPINIASSNAVSLKMLFEMCFEIVGGGKVFYDITKSVGNSVYDTRRMKEFFPDIQETSLKVGIENLYNYLVNKNAGC